MNSVNILKTQTKSDLHFRVADPVDLNSVIKLVSNCICYMRASGIDQWDEIYPNEKTFSEDIDSRTLYICEQQNQLVGCGVLNGFQDPGYISIPWRLLDSPIGVIHRLMIAPERQGQGVAKVFMNFLESVAFSRGFRSIRLDAFTENNGALALYDKIGYNRVGIVQFRKGLFFCFEKKVNLTL